MLEPGVAGVEQPLSDHSRNRLDLSESENLLYPYLHAFLGIPRSAGRTDLDEPGPGSCPPRHRKIPHLLNVLAGSGFLIVIWGTYALNLWALGYGFALVYLGKFWYLDRMVWLYQDMQDLTGNQIPPK